MSAASSFTQSITDQSLARPDVAALASLQQPVRLIGCDLENVDLAEFELPGWSFERCVLRNTKFSGTKLEVSHWEGCRGAFADFTGADLTDAVFQGVDFNNGSFRRSALSAASFRSCKLTGADLTDAITFDAIFEETLFIAAKLRSWSFRDMTLQGLDFSQADLRKCDFRHAVFQVCSLREANVAGARLRGRICGVPTSAACTSETPRFSGEQPFRDSRQDSYWQNWGSRFADIVSCDVASVRY